VTNSDLWPRIELIYHAALTRAERDRPAFVQEACDGDVTLRREVESLLGYAARAQAFMAAPALEMMARELQPEPQTLVGRRFGPFEIQSRLGAGGMGEVYRAHDTKLGRDVAVKILPRVFNEDADRRARFEREARLLASLSHPNIGAIFGLEHSGGVHGLVLELVEGQTLGEVLKDGPLPVEKALTFARQIAEALEAAHDRGIVHRDLKPENIAITRDGIVKVFDFGIAKSESGESGSPAETPTRSIAATHEGVILGTAAYMSPEQARGKTVDRRTDIWAFGCVTLEMLSGRKVFGGDTVSDTLVAILDRDPDWSALPESTPPSIRRLLKRCLEKDVKQRVHHIADARLEIEDALREPTTSSAVVQPTELRGTGGRRRVAALVACAAALGAAAGASVSWRPQAAASPSPVARVTVTVPPGHAVERSQFPPLALSPDGSLLVYAAAAGGGRTNLYIRPLDELSARPVAAAQGASVPFFSADGRWLAFYAEGVLKKVPVTGGLPLTICEAPPLSSATWGQNDQIVFATAGTSSGLWSVPAAGGEPTPITSPRDGDALHGYPQLLPDGRHVLFSVRRDNGWQLAWLDLERRDWHVLGGGRPVGEGAQFLPSGHVVYAQAGGLVASPFDPTSGELGEPVPLLERIARSHFGGAYFTFAATAGTLVYLPPGAPPSGRTLLRIERDGRSAPLIDARAAYESPALAPNGRQVAVTVASEAGSDVWIIDLDRHTRVRFTAGGGSAFPVWARDGSRIAFQAGARGPWNLFSKPIDERTAAEPLLPPAEPAAANRSWPNAGANLLPGPLPTLSGAGPQFPSSWAPDGLTFAFHERKPNGERDIWTVSPGSEPLPFLLTPFDEHSPRFSPDGKWLAYVSDESGQDDVYVQPFPGPGQKWLVSTDGGSDPLWSKDGKELFYRAGGVMMAVLVALRDGFSAARPRRLFEIPSEARDNGANYDVSSDGSWFVVPGSNPTPPASELHVVLNWLTEVKSRAQSRRGLRDAGAPSIVTASWQRVQ
jgi:eukaryotic-like serine/threonine-protein kinase